jgi:single-strand DNA-binding protein
VHYHLLGTTFSREERFYMASTQHVVVAGHLGAQPELKVTSAGVPMCTFSVAVDRPYRDNSGERITDWIRVRAWREVAEAAAQYLRKGSFVVIQGRFESYAQDLTLDGGEIRRVKSWTLVVEDLTFGPKVGTNPVVDAQEEPEPPPPPAPASKPAATKQPATRTKAVRSE